MENVSRFQNRNADVDRRIQAFHEKAPEILMPEQAKVIKNFDRFNSANDLSPLTRRNYVKNLSWLAETIKKPFEKMTREDIETFIQEISKDNGATYIQNIKIQIKRFFRYLYNSEEFPEIVKWMVTKKSVRHKEATKKILTLEERKALLSSCKNQRDRALVTFLDQTGCRATECVLTRIGDVVPDTKADKMTLPCTRIYCPLPASGRHRQ